MTVLDLAGSVALLLWGVHMVQSGVQRALGPNLRRVLAAALGNRAKALFAGLGVTALLQSSTATGFMLTSFAADGLVALVPALAAMLGANIGTTLIVQALSFDVARFAPVLVLIGVVGFRRGSTRTRDFGRVAIGLGLLLMALARLVEITRPYEDQPSLRLLLGTLASDPLMDVLVAAALTWAAHSSVAVVLFVMSLAANGVVPPAAAFALVIGANIGTSLNPVIEGAPGGDPAARRLPIGNLLIRSVFGMMALSLIGPISRWMVVVLPDQQHAVAAFHTAFNVALALVALPLLGPYARLLCRLLPRRVEDVDPSRPLYLDHSALDNPPVAVANAAREALHMADVLAEMLTGAEEALLGSDRRRIEATKRLDDVLDRLNSAIQTYLGAIDPESMSEADHRRLMEVLAFAINVEHAGDAIERNLMAHAGKRLKRGVSFPSEGVDNIRTMAGRLSANLRSASAVFIAQDTRAARRLAAEKRAFRNLETEANEAHLQRLRSGGSVSQDSSALYVDVLRDLKLINGYLVAAAAYPVLATEGELLTSRLRQDV